MDWENPGTRRFAGEHLNRTQTRMVCRSVGDIVPSHAAGVNDQDVRIYGLSFFANSDRTKTGWQNGG